MPPLLPQDKANHDFYGSLIAAMTVIVSLVLYPLLIGFGFKVAESPQLLAGIAQAVVALIAALKEWVYDAAHADTHTVDWRDFAMTFGGGLKVTIPLFLMGALL